MEKVDGGVMVEVGSAFGESAVLFAEKFNEVHCVDFWERSMAEREPEFDKKTNGFKNIIKHKGLSEVIVKEFADGSLDGVYIDANHNYEFVRADIEMWLPKIKKGGWIGGHDYSYSFLGVIRAVHEKFDRPDYVFMDSSWLIIL